MEAMRLPVRHCDLFCRVVDNFGDAGVCWRLAGQLAREHGWQVRLIIDDAAPLTALSGVTAGHAVSLADPGSVRIVPWHDALRADADLDVVIEAFACKLPDVYEDSLAAVATSRARPPVWLNLEYLSAEDWTVELHGRASPHPRLPLTKYFFFPGFDPRGGGLPIERDLHRRYEAVDAERAGTWRELGLPGTLPDRRSRLVSLFAYENPAIEPLVDGWRHASGPTVLVVPASRAMPDVSRALHTALPASGTVQDGALTVHTVPFLRQDDYDRLLRLADFNFVRGEDSFVRAQLAGRPFCWQIYTQDDGAHLVKLEAFLQRYLAGLDDSCARAITACFDRWNRPDRAQEVAAAWQKALAHWPTWCVHATGWARQCVEQTSLASKLVEFTQERL